MATTAYDFDATALDGSPQPLSDWRGSVSGEMVVWVMVMFMPFSLWGPRRPL